MNKETEEKLWQQSMDIQSAVNYIENKIFNVHSSYFHDEELTHIWYILKGRSDEYEEIWMQDMKSRNLPPKR